MVFNIFRRGKVQYLLRAICVDGKEDLGVFDRKVSVVEVSDLIEGLEERCYRVVLYEVVDGNTKKALWNKTLRRKSTDSIMSDLKKWKEINAIMKELRGDRSVSEYMAEAVMLLKSLRELAHEVSPQSGGDLHDLIELFKALSYLRGYGVGSEVPGQQFSVIESTPLVPKEKLYSVKEESLRKADEILEKAFSETTKVIAPCMDGGKCLEVDEGGESVEGE
ncbi:MAG: hypothetical protein QW267_06670 [Sulfolobales archaeon]